MLSVYDLELGRLSAELPLDSNPATMDPIGDGSVFVLNHIEKQHVPLIVVDTRTGPAVYFIPASELN